MRVSGLNYHKRCHLCDVILVFLVYQMLQKIHEFHAFQDDSVEVGCVPGRRLIQILSSDN